MCRSTDYRRFHSITDITIGLKIKAFFIHFSHLQQPLPESLTLLYLPRVDDTVLEIDGTKIRPDSPAFVSLHRVVSSSGKKGVVFGSGEQVRVGEGVLQFQVYLREEKVMHGFFRKGGDGEWEMELRSVLESEIVGAEVSETAVCVDVEGGGVMFEKVALRVRRRKKRNFSGLEEIPEGREADNESDGCSCSCRGVGIPSEDGGDVDAEDGEGGEVELMGVEGVRLAVDVGIWVVCLGVGYLVSRASAKTLRRKRII